MEVDAQQAMLTDGAGKAALSRLFGGTTHFVKITLPGYYPKTLSFDPLWYARGGPIPVALDSAKAEIVFQVKDERGNPVPNAVVTLDDGTTKKTYVDGTVALDVKKLADYKIAVAKSGYYTEDAILRVEQDRKDVSIIMRPEDENAPNIVVIGVDIVGDEDSVLEEREKMKFVYTVSDESGIREVRVMLDGKEIDSYSKAGSYTTTTPPLLIGSHKVTIEATDNDRTPTKNSKEIPLVVSAKGPSVRLTSTSTNLTVGDNAVLTLSAFNPSGKNVTVRLVAKVPSGIAVGGTSNVREGANVLTNTYQIRPGRDTEYISLNLAGTQKGKHSIEGELIYSIEGEEGEFAQHAQLDLSVEGRETATPTSTPQPPPKRDCFLFFCWEKPEPTPTPSSTTSAPSLTVARDCFLFIFCRDRLTQSPQTPTPVGTRSGTEIRNETRSLPPPPKRAPEVSLRVVYADSTSLCVEHLRGDAINLSTMKVVVDGDVKSAIFLNSSGVAMSRLNPGEAVVIRAGGPIRVGTTVQLIDDASHQQIAALTVNVSVQNVALCPRTVIQDFLSGPVVAQETTVLRSPETLARSGYVGRVVSLAWSPDGTLLASGGDYPDNVIRIWDPLAGRALRTLDGRSTSVSSVVWSHDGGLLASKGASAIHIWDPSTGAPLRSLQGSQEAMRSLVSFHWSLDGDRIISISGDRTMQIWDARSGSLLRTIERRSRAESWIGSASWSPDGTRVVTGSYDGNVRLWDATTGDLLQTLTGHSQWVASVSWSPDGTKIASSSMDGTTRIWDATTGTLLRVIEKSGPTVSWSPDGTVLATGSGGGVLILDPETGRLLRTLTGSSKYSNLANVLAWNPSESSLAAGSGDDFIYIWD